MCRGMGNVGGGQRVFIIGESDGWRGIKVGGIRWSVVGWKKKSIPNI